MRTDKSNACLFVCLILMTGLRAYAGNAGSAYSRYGIGDIQLAGSDRSFGMGGVHYAVFSPAVIDWSNPGALSAIKHTRFSISSLYEGFSSNDGSNKAFLTSVQFSGLSLAVPVETDLGIVFSAGVAPYSRIEYETRVPGSESGLSYDVSYRGSGGVSEAYAGLSAIALGSLSLGATFNYYFGTLDHTTEQTFTSGGYTNGLLTQSTRVRGVGMTTGVVYSGLSPLLGLGENESLNLGAVLSFSSSLTAEQDEYYLYKTSIVSIRDTVTRPDSKIDIPVTFGGGISYTNSKVLLAADLTLQQWKASEGIPGSDQTLRSSLRIGAGAELLPKRENLTPFAQRIAYRIGAFHNRSYYQISGTGIDETGVTGGIGLPVYGDTRFNIGASYSFRGTNDNQLIKDRIFRISLTLSVGEVWFIRPPEE